MSKSVLVLYRILYQFKKVVYLFNKTLAKRFQPLNLNLGMVEMLPKSPLCYAQFWIFWDPFADSVLHFLAVAFVLRFSNRALAP